MIISEDRLKAWIVLPDPTLPGYQPVTLDALASALRAAGIPLSADAQARIEALLQLVSQSGGDGRPEIPRRYLIAEGRAAREATDGHVAWSSPLTRQAARWSEPGAGAAPPIDAVVIVRAGDVLGRLEAPAPGASGADVTGRALPPYRTGGRPLRLGATVGLSRDENIIARTSGRPAIRENVLDIAPLEELNEISADAGTLDRPTDLHVHGDVGPGAVVRGARGMTIGGAVRGAEIGADADVVVRAEIRAEAQPAQVRAHRSIYASAAHAARLNADGDIWVARELRDCLVWTRGRLRVEGGAIVGGSAFAQQGIRAATLGDPHGTATCVAVGPEPRVLRQAQEMEAAVRQRREHAHQLRLRIQPLLANLSRLSPAQREHVLSLIARAEEIEMSIEETQTDRKRLLEQATPPRPAVVLIGREVYPGARVTIGLRETLLLRVLRGPLRIELRQTGTAEALVAVHELSGAVTALPPAPAAESPRDRAA